MPKCPKPAPSQAWRTFLQNHMSQRVAVDFFTVPTVNFRQSCFDYYHGSRTYLSLSKDCPEPRSVHPPEMGNVVEFPEVGGLHHRYERRTAA
ncbi:MAG: hypothetical protein ABIK09_18200 [Pseudomonadota bacterium]